MKTRGEMKGRRILYGLVGALLILALSAVVGRGARTQAAAVDETLLLAVENAAGQDPAAAASRVFAAESSRNKLIRDSIEASISLEQSVAESKAEANRLLLESILAAGAARESRAASIAESRSVEVSVEESVRQSLEESAAESRRAAEAASRAAASRAAAEAASRAAAEAASRAAASRAAAEAAAQPARGSVILFGDSRTQGFINFWPTRQVIFTYDPISAHPELITKAASAYPSKIVFLNGIDDVLVYSADGAIGSYEAAITRFAALSPSSRIYVHSVLPVRADVSATYVRLKGIDRYNQLLQQMCAKHGWTYIDCRAGFSDAAYWPGGDGIHFNNTWTSNWLGQIRKAAGF